MLVKVPESEYFYTYLTFQNWKSKNSVELPMYLVEKGKKDYIIDPKPIFIKDEEETILVIREGFYGLEKGVDLKITEDQIL